MNIELLNAAKDFIINQANEEGVLLADIFGTPEDFRQAVISIVITTVMDIMSVEMPEAYDIVMGDGSYQKLLDMCWAELNPAQ